MKSFGTKAHPTILSGLKKLLVHKKGTKHSAPPSGAGKAVPAHHPKKAFHYGRSVHEFGG